MSCKARLAVYMLFCSIFFADSRSWVIFALYITGISAAVVTNLILKIFIPRTDHQNIILQLPDYQMPNIKISSNRAYKKTMSFVKSAGKMITICFFIIHCLNHISVNDLISHKEVDYSPNNVSTDYAADNSILYVIGKNMTPIFKPMGIEENNWEATITILTGIIGKELVISSLNALYLPNPEESKDITTLGNDFVADLSRYVKSLFYDEEGYDSDRAFDSVIQNKFNGRIAVFSYLLFIMLYFPCISVFSVISRELGMKWACFSVIWSTMLAYIYAVSFYQIVSLIYINLW